MNIAYKLDRVGSDHALRHRFRDFLLVRSRWEPDGSVLDRLQSSKDVPAAKVKIELEALIAAKWSYDDVYAVTTDDLRDFLAYTEVQVKVEKAMISLKKAVRMAKDAGIDYRDLQSHAVDIYEDLLKEDQDAEDRMEEAVRPKGP